MLRAAGGKTRRMRRLSAVIVDDERLARSELRRLLEEIPSVEVAGEAASVTEAQVLIEDARPDMIFLDIQLGGETGLDLLAWLPAQVRVVLVTAYEERSVPFLQGRESSILAKPVNPRRLRAILERYAAQDE
jgi:two-component system LytT family response regulator